VLEELFDLHEAIMKLSVERDGITYTFVDLCYPIYEGGAISMECIPLNAYLGPCYINTPLSVWNYNKTAMLNDPDPHQSVNEHLYGLMSIVGNYLLAQRSY
jgi:hypothetical protein